MLWGAAVVQLRQMGGSVPGRTSLVRGFGLAVDVGVEHSWSSSVEVFQHTLSARWAPMLAVIYAASSACGDTKGIPLGGVLIQSVL